MKHLSYMYANIFANENQIIPVKFDNDDELMPIMRERSRFKEIVNLIDMLNTKVNNEEFSDSYTTHFFIRCSDINDGLVASIAICNIITQKADYYVGDYLVNRSTVNLKASLEKGEDSEMGMKVVIKADSTETGFYDDDYDDEDGIFEIKDRNPSMFLFHETSTESIFRYDCDGVKVCFVIYVDDLVKKAGIAVPPRQAADMLGYTYLDIPQESNEELEKYIDYNLKRYGFSTENVQKLIKEVAENSYIKNEYSAVAAARKIVNRHIGTYGSIDTLEAADFSDYIMPEAKKGNGINLIGLEKERHVIEGMLNSLTLDIERKRRGISNDMSGCNMVFAGLPGTAKTTLAREFARILSERRLIPGIESFRECSKSDIVGQYVGHTAKQIDDLFRNMSENGGGVIFFDEIYSISEKDSTSYDKEAVTCITKNMEDHRSDVFCIFAGYENKMQEFLESNPGLNSRISTTIRFKPYDTETLCKIFESIVTQNNFKIKGEYRDIISDFFVRLKKARKENFGNGREARNLFENTKRIMADRICTHKKYNNTLLTTMITEDIQKAAEEIIDSVIKDECNDKKTIGFGI